MAIQKNHVNERISSAFQSAPARVIAPKKQIEIGQVIVILSQKKDERILPEALAFARQRNAELVVAFVYPIDKFQETRQYTERYVKSIRNKVEKQYDKVQVLLHYGNNVPDALQSVINEKLNPCLLHNHTHQSWWSRIWGSEVTLELKRHYANLSIQVLETA